jgi:hypothetical protein
MTFLPHKAVATWSVPMRAWACRRCGLRLQFSGGYLPVHRATRALRWPKRVAVRTRYTVVLWWHDIRR